MAADGHVGDGRYLSCISKHLGVERMHYLVHLRPESRNRLEIVSFLCSARCFHVYLKYMSKETQADIQHLLSRRLVEGLEATSSVSRTLSTKVSVANDDV
jgi:hypothetical protein